MKSLTFVVAALVTRALAHGGVVSYTIDGTTYAGWQPYNSPTGQSTIERPYSSYDPILSVSAATFSCNNNGASGAGQKSATVRAGASITAKWSQWTHAQGPSIVYMAKCPSTCTSANSNSLSWFKIYEHGLLSGNLPNGAWGTGEVLKTLTVTSTIPASLAAGEYLIRHELLAVHQANTPQFYPECAQLIVTGGGGKTPAGQYLVKFPGGYSASDPSININIYSAEAANTTTYKVPGPPVWNGQ
ncbi:cellulose-growth-specific protein [Pluteus cervinus]|uniref:Cellulose-growth-specific protein n=1 Tax=Pluteus cervinus TaxID=181527 RepID=A0ACD3B150_9AGAR|nr:cellulose-growth-specific protein [Pluteus cervinus]